MKRNNKIKWKKLNILHEQNSFKIYETIQFIIIKRL